MEAKVEKENLLLNHPPELFLHILQLLQSRGKAAINDIVTITNANRNTVKKTLGAPCIEILLTKMNVKRLFEINDPLISRW